MASSSAARPGARGKAPAAVQRRAAASPRDLGPVVNSLPFIVWTAGPDGAIDGFNDALPSYTGMDPAALLGTEWATAIHPDDIPAIGLAQGSALATGDPYEMEFRLRRADGEFRWHLARATSERGDDGEISRWWGNVVDVHDAHMLREDAARLAIEREDVLQSIGDGVYTLDHDMRFTYLNGRAEELVRHPAGELIGERVWDKFPEIRGTEVEEAFDAALATGETQRFQTYNPVLETWFDVNANPTRLGLTVYFRDITELRVVTEQLERAQRMESIGRLTGGIAHDFNNLLTVVLGGAEALGDEAGLSPEGRQMIGLVASAAARGAQLTHHLLAFARRQPLAPKSVDASSLILETTPLLARALGHGIEVATRLGDDLPPVLVDPSQLENVLLNLAINARDAMPDGGTLTLETRLVHLDVTYTTQHTEIQPGDYVLVSVHDTGTGIAADDVPHLFEPFFTTKAAGEGSGLGLAMVWGFAKQTGGHVTVYSELDIGTSFHLYLPLAATPPDAAVVQSRPSGAVPSRGGHILVAEDDPLVQQFAAARLRESGYTVTTAGTGAEALERLEGIPDLALLFTDVIMIGGMSGRELADAVVARRPGTPVLFASGYTVDVVVHNGRLDPDVELLAKPYHGTQLADRIGEILAARASDPSI